MRMKPLILSYVILTMKPHRCHSAVSLSLGLLFCLPALSYAAESTIKEREHHQQDRIADGIKSGELTPAEAARLEQREKDLKKQMAEDRAANGGKLTAEERKQMQKELNGISKRIHHQKNDGQKTRGHPKSEVGQREVDQQDRIAGGIASGQLTPTEARNLEERESVLQKQIAEDRAANGGKLTPQQRAQVNQELDEIGARIHSQKHDGQTQSGAK